MYFNCTYYDENNNVISVELECDKCNLKNEIKYDENIFSEVNNDSCVVKNGDIITCVHCKNKCQTGRITYKTEKDNGYFNVIHKNNQHIANAQAQEWLNKPKCPICNSTNLSKLSNVGKVAKVGLFGIFGAGDIGKTWKCNNCGSKF